MCFYDDVDIFALHVWLCVFVRRQNDHDDHHHLHNTQQRTKVCLGGDFGFSDYIHVHYLHASLTSLWRTIPYENNCAHN